MKQTVFLTGTFAALLLTASFSACSSTEKLGFNDSTATGLDALPQTALTEGYILEGEERNAAANFASGATLTRKQKDAWHVQDGSITVETDGIAQLLEDEDSDGMLAVHLGLNDSDKTHSITFDISDAGKHPKNISQTIVKLHVYIPKELAYNNADRFNGIINFQISDVNGKTVTLGGLLQNVSFQDIGTGWKTITLNLAYHTFYLGRSTGTFELSDITVLNRAKSFTVTVQGKKVDSNLDVPVLIDWIDFSALPER
ncbi:MAG: hypothetical protein IIT68_06020 [Treponema sp.]|nr:hypothetical protein [Treponema sp.]